jgi:fatty-acyl-CoA synthase
MKHHATIYDQQLEKNAANYVPLSPLGFLERAAEIYPERTSIIDGEVSYTWRETYDRCRKLAHALQKRGLKYGDTVSIMARNIPEHIEVFFGVPMCGAIINGLNIRLDAAMLAFMLAHSETKILLVDRQFSPVIQDALALMKGAKPTIIDIDDTDPDLANHPLIGEKNYAALLDEGDADFNWVRPQDEWQALALNYTSGTTGDPKGVVYHHRGAYLNAIGNVLAWAMPPHPVYLWTLPMFHASGWCFHWTLAAVAGTHICLRKVVAKDIFTLLEKHRVTHFTAAPIVLNFLINAKKEDQKQFDHTIEVMTAGSAPAATVLAHMDNMGFNVTHVYGATEVFGPNMSCAWKPEWDGLGLDERAALKARQGVRTVALEKMMVADDHMQELPWDGKSIGEVMMRGNVVMKGYLKNPETTKATFKGEWYHTGDLAVRHLDGYVEIKDRLKDIIISGAENISSIEVESALYKHPAILEAAIVAMPHEKWGETPCAFIELKPDMPAPSAAEVIAHCKEHLAGYKVPRTIIFGPLEKTSTGKIQKYLLREKAQNLPAIKETA